MTPTHRLYADALAWPLVAPGSHHQLPGPNWPALRQTFRAQQLARGLPESLIQDALTEHLSGKTTHLAHLRTIARQLLHREGHTWRLQRYRGPEPCALDQPLHLGEEVLRWRWLTLALPPGLLLALAARPGQRPPHRVQLLHRHQAPTHRIAHHHLHVGAAQPFALLWARTATHLSSNCPWDSGTHPTEDWLRWLPRVFIARRWLAEEVLGPSWCPPLGMSTHEFERHQTDALDNLRTFTLPETSFGTKVVDAALRSIATARDRPCTPAGSPARVWTQDPIADGGPWPEGELLRRCADRCETLPQDLEFALTLRQYLRLKTRLYRHLVSDPSRPGLSTFVETYNNLRPYHLVSPLAGLAVAMDEPELNLGAVELRTAPPSSLSELLDMVSHKDDDRAPAQRSQDPDLEWAWILHFIRAKGPLDPQKPNLGATLRARARESYLQSRSLTGWLTDHPQLLAVVRALDLAGSERDGPLWLFVPALVHLRDASRRLSTQLTPHTPPLRMTLHAGEDPRTLLTGVREVAWPLQWDLLQPGDRLGHALVLGADPQTWIDEQTQPRLERMLDLLWAVDTAEALGVPMLNTLRTAMRTEAAKLAREIWLFTKNDYEQTILGELSTLMKDLGDPTFLPRCGAMDLVAPVSPPPRDARMVALLFDPDTAQRAFVSVPVDTAPERALVAQLHHEVRVRLARAEICIELNPSSNLVIGALKAPVAQACYQLLGMDPNVHDAVAVSINADDPTSFSTRLADELAVARAGLVLGSDAAPRVAPRVAQAWLDRAADASWRHRFALSESKDLAAHHPAPDVLPGYRRWAHCSDEA